jgi:hypothetical protein
MSGQGAGKTRLSDQRLVDAAMSLTVVIFGQLAALDQLMEAP